MATKTKKRGRSSDPDPQGRYRIEYYFPAPNPITEEFDLPPARPRWLSRSARGNVQVLTQTVTGKRQMETVRASIRSAGGVVTRVTRTNWFG